MSKHSTPGVPGQDPTSAHNTNPATERDLLEEVAELDASVIAAMPRVERAAFKRELLSAIRRATWAAERLADLEEAEEPEAEEEEEEGPVTEQTPKHIPTLALTSDGTVLIAIHYVEGADLTDRETWMGVVLTEAEACDALDRMSDAADDAAAHIGGRIVKLSKKRERDDE